MFKHFIITRFNIRMESNYDFDKNKKSTNTDEWLEDRFFLFEKYCFPSLKNQSNLNFIWFVLFDAQTPEKYRKLIDCYKQLLPQFVPLYFQDGMYSAMREAINKAMFDYLKEDDRYVITTRIDNDDAFHRNMIDEVQSRFNEQNNIFLNFNNGFQYDVEKEILVKMKYINNHFISRIEQRNAVVETVITYNHALINEVGEVVSIENKEPLWIEVIHNGNISNGLRLSLPKFSSQIFKSFGFSADISLKNSLIFLLQHVKRITLHGLLVLSKKIKLYKPLKRIKRYITKEA